MCYIWIIFRKSSEKYRQQKNNPKIPGIKIQITIIVAFSFFSLSSILDVLFSSSLQIRQQHGNSVVDNSVRFSTLLTIVVLIDVDGDSLLDSVFKFPEDLLPLHQITEDKRIVSIGHICILISRMLHCAYFVYT